MALRLSTIINRMRSFRNPSQYKEYSTVFEKAVGAPKTKSIYIKSSVRGEGGNYDNWIQFFDVPFSEEEVKGWHAINVGKKAYWFKPFRVSENRVKLYCKCPDMQFTFSYQLWEKDSHIGAYKKYKRVPGSTRPPRNPRNLPGFCKHTYSHLHELKRRKILVGL